MSDFQDFLAEKNAIDGYLEQDYRIVGVTEELDGDRLRLQPPSGAPDSKPVTLLIQNANARKYWSTLLFASSESDDL
ncbi:hypothetical protein [Paenibacillus sp. OV219]|uniref:hypothetical protein n=1 Tax=Paenibacillus sp. OV219 TaxID=1884377 RepID=UPI0008B9D858|nr:hypothetical protein [Paenibacillus sp. OV219]SEM73664.1 hypothetical protein SAMN05518847_101658 [Paenibacillus sp. OV219]